MDIEVIDIEKVIKNSWKQECKKKIDDFKQRSDADSAFMKQFLSFQLELFNISICNRLRRKKGRVFPASERIKIFLRKKRAIRKTNLHKNNILYSKYKKKRKIENIQEKEEEYNEGQNKMENTNEKDETDTQAKKKKRTETGSTPSKSSSFRSLTSYFGIGERKRKSYEKNGKGKQESFISYYTKSLNYRKDGEKYVFPREKLKDVIKDQKGIAILSEVGRYLLIKQNSNDLIDIAVCENEIKNQYEISFFYAGGLSINYRDMEKVKNTCEERFRNMTVVPIELDEKDKKENYFNMMTQIIVCLSC